MQLTNTKDLLLFLSRQKQLEDIDAISLEEQKTKATRIKSSGASSLKIDANTQSILDTSMTNISVVQSTSSNFSMSDFSLKNATGSSMSVDASISEAVGSAVANSVGKSSVSLKSPISINFLSSGVANIYQFGIVELTGTNGQFKNAYTIGKGSQERASAHVDYMDREENNEKVGELFNRFGEPITKEEAKETLDEIKAERRFTFSPNPRLNLGDDDIKNIAIKTMNDYVEVTGKEFDYVAALHKNTDIRHVHILMTSKDWGGDGVKMYKDELFELKKSFNENIQQVAEHNKEIGLVNYNNKTDVGLARQIGNFIGAVPNAYMFNQNKYLAEQISKRYDLNYNKKEIENDNSKLEKWFEKNQENYQKFFLSSGNKKSYLFDEYLKSAENLSNKYDLGFKEEFKKDTTGFKEWLEDKKDVFIADKIATDKNIDLSKSDMKLELNTRTDKKEYRLTKWFEKNESSLKEWNKENIDKPSKDIASTAKNFLDKVDVAPEQNILQSRKETLSFIRTMKQNPMEYANEARIALNDVLEDNKKQFYRDYKTEEIEYKEFRTHTDRLNGLQDRLGNFYDVTTQSLSKYGIDTDFFDKKNNEIYLDGIKLDKNIEKNLFKKVDKLQNQKNKSYISRVKYGASQNGNISISSLENIGLKRDDLTNNFKVEKIPVSLENIDFQSTQQKIDLGEKDLKQWFEKVELPIEKEQELQPKEMKQELYNLYKKDENTTLEEETKNPIIAAEDSFSNEKYEEIKERDYKEVFKEIKDLNFDVLSMYENKDDFYKLFAVIANAKDAKDIDTLIKAYELDSLSDKSQMVKDFGEALSVDAKEIKKSIWFDKTGDNDLQSESTLKFIIDDYKEQFIEKFINEVSIEYLLHVSDSSLSSEFAKKKFENFNTILQNFKEEYFSNEEYQKNIETVKEHLENGEFKSAKEVIENSNLEDIDTKILNNYYEEYINLFANNLESVKEHVENDNDLNMKTYLLSDMLDKDVQSSLVEEAIESYKDGELEKIEELLQSTELDAEHKEQLQMQYDLHKYQDEDIDEKEIIDDEIKLDNEDDKLDDELEEIQKDEEFER